MIELSHKPLIRAYRMDCMGFMADKPDGCYPLAIVDPPYGIGMDGGNVGYRGFNNFEKKDWDQEKPPKAYFENLFRISDNQIIWGGNYFGLPPTRGFIVWDKGRGFKGRTYAEGELAWTSFDRNAQIFEWDPLARGDYHGKINPCQKPVSLYRWLLTNYAKSGQTILDTHGGSFSSAIACWHEGYDMDICEIDEEYFEAACERFERETRQQKLFGIAKTSMGGNGHAMD